MENTNTTQSTLTATSEVVMAPPATAPAQVVTQPPAAPLKTYTERFNEMERESQKMRRNWNEANMAFNATAGIVKSMFDDARLLVDQLQALYDLLEPVGITRDKVRIQINLNREKKVQDLLNKDEAANIIKKVDAVMDEFTLVAYSSDEAALAFKPASAFDKEGLKVEDLIGKKAGDVLGSITIKQTYVLVDQKPDEGQNEQAKQ